MATSGDHHVLPMIATCTVGHRRGLAACRQVIFPQLTTGLQVECTEVAVHGGADEYQVASGYDGTAHMGGPKIACWCEPRADALRGPEWDLPHNPVASQVDADQRPPGRGRAGQSPR